MGLDNNWNLWLSVTFEPVDLESVNGVHLSYPLRWGWCDTEAEMSRKKLGLFS